MLLIVSVEVASAERSIPLVVIVGFPSKFTWSFSTSRLLLVPYAKPGGVPFHAAPPTPPKSVFVDKLPHVVEEGFPVTSNDAEVTSAPYGNVRFPAKPLPVPENVCV